MTFLNQLRDQHKNSNNPKNYWDIFFFFCQSGTLLRGCASSSSSSWLHGLTLRGRDGRKCVGKQGIITFTFTFMHLADTFIQSDLQCIQAIHFLSVCVYICVCNNICKQEERKRSSDLQRLDKVWRDRMEIILCFMGKHPFQTKKTDILHMWCLIVSTGAYKNYNFYFFWRCK